MTVPEVPFRDSSSLPALFADPTSRRVLVAMDDCLMRHGILASLSTLRPSTYVAAITPDQLAQAEAAHLVVTTSEIAPLVPSGPAVLSLVSDGSAPNGPGEMPTTATPQALAARVSSLLSTPPPNIDLSPREIEVLTMAYYGLTGREIAERCFISADTVKTHFAHIYRKLDVSDRSAAIRVALSAGVIPA